MPLCKESFHPTYFTFSYLAVNTLSFITASLGFIPVLQSLSGVKGETERSFATIVAGFLHYTSGRAPCCDCEGDMKDSVTLTLVY